MRLHPYRQGLPAAEVKKARREAENMKDRMQGLALAGILVMAFMYAINLWANAAIRVHEADAKAEQAKADQVRQ